MNLRAWALFACLAAAVFVATDARADTIVPVGLQAQLVGRMAAFDRNFQARAGTVATVLVVRRADDATSRAQAASLAKSLSELRDIGGLPPRVEEIDFADGPRLAAACRARRVAIVYFTSGLEGEMGQVASALTGADVLTVGTTAKYAEAGTVAGIGLEEARPKLVLNLARAKAQNVQFKAELIRLARLVP